MFSTTNSNTAVRALAIAAGLGVVALLPLVVQDRFWLNLLVMVWIYTILALGLNVLFGFARQISFGHGGFFAIGAYTSALLSLEAGFNVWLAMAVATVAAGVLGYAIGRPLVRLRGLSLAMATLAFGQMIFILSNQLSITGGPIGIAGIPAPEVGPISFADSRNYYWLTAAVAMVVLVISRHICSSGVGRGLRALGVSEVAAEVAGVNTNAYKAATFVYSAGLAGLAGALFAHYFTFISSDAFGLDLSVLGVIIIVVGGLYSLWGALIGAFAITFLRESLRSYQEYSELVYGVLLIAIFMAAPNGIVGVGSYALTWARGLGRRDGGGGTTTAPSTTDSTVA